MRCGPESGLRGLTCPSEPLRTRKLHTALRCWLCRGYRASADALHVDMYVDVSRAITLRRAEEAPTFQSHHVGTADEAAGPMLRRQAGIAGRDFPAHSIWAMHLASSISHDRYYLDMSCKEWHKFGYFEVPHV